ncbi:MAG: hypothetical protein C4540_00460 [Candidatus Omnitrophota bacterium]|jgi:hypothetical protein|nr:MAG: hypothetical protein C4540_00460 [Candidatus Omnitrophota bacterium]
MMKIEKILSWVMVIAVVFQILGCEAFVRKFSRKPKKDSQAKEEMVLVPEDYSGPGLSKEELYRQYFLFWKSWQDELIVALSSASPHKKQVDCANEALKNLNAMNDFLSVTKREALKVFINQLGTLQIDIEKDVYGYKKDQNRATAEQIKRNILVHFSYARIKEDLR